MNNNQKREDIIMLKEKINNDFYCQFCYKAFEKKSQFILYRIRCMPFSGYHYVAYEKFDYTLTSFVKSEDYTEKNVEKIIINILSEIESLHQQNIYIFNINPDGIAINKNCAVYFLDFFMSRNSKENPVIPLSSRFGPNDFAAPELILFRMNGKQFDNHEAADIFSIFCCIFFSFTLYNPFEKNRSHTCKNIMNKEFKIKFRTLDYVMILDSYKIFLLKNLMQKTLFFEPNRRFNFHDIRNHPFFWDLQKVSDFFFNNSKKIENPTEHLRGENFDEGRYTNFLKSFHEQKQELLGFVRNETEENNIFNHNNFQLTTFILENFPTLFHDLWNNNEKSQLVCPAENIASSNSFFNDLTKFSPDFSPRYNIPQLSTNTPKMIYPLYA
ncbi:hypothetical protein ACKWTF_014838 [Chironomus riparius]